MFRDLHGATQIHQPAALSFCFSTYSPWKLISLPPDGQKWKKSRSNFWGTLNSLRKITIVLERSLSEASWQQRAGESLKRTVFTLKQWFFWGGGVQRKICKEGTLPHIAGKQIYWKKPSLLSLLGSKMWNLKRAVPKQRCFKCWHCGTKTWQSSVGPKYKVHLLFKFTFSLHGFRVHNHPN